MTEAKRPDAVTLARASRYLGVSVRSVQRLIRKGKLVALHYQDLRATRIDTDSLIAYRQQAQARPPAAMSTGD